VKIVNNILYITGSEFIKYDDGNGIVSKEVYNKQRQRGKLNIVGRGGNGRQVLIEFNSLPPVYKKLVQEQLCGGEDMETYMQVQPLRDLIKPDIKAIEFFDRYQLPDGRLLKEKLKRNYIKSASVLNMISSVYDNKKWLKKELNMSLQQFWNVVVKMKEVKDAGLPGTIRHLKPKWQSYKEEGYKGLITAKIGNQNRTKVTPKLEKLILSLYVQDTKPYVQDILDDYKAFMRGDKEIVDTESGVLLYPTMFLGKNEKPVELSKTTVWNIINDPENKIIVDKMRLSRLEFNGRHRPYNSRIAPQYAFSKLTMDDRCIPFKMEDGKRAWTYIIADVASQCIVGQSYSRSTEDGSGKNRELFKEAMMNMFRLMVQNGWGMPAEIEVEHHISNTFVGKTDENGVFTPDLLTNNYLFPFVTFCNPANPQQKRAEHIIRQIKYQIEQKIAGFQGRPFARQDSNRLNSDKKGTRYTFDEVVANIEAGIHEWNNQLHPNQEKYTGLTRWQVLERYQNPQLVRPYLPAIAKYIGNKRVTSIERTEVRAFNNLYIVAVNEGLLNSTTVTAYGIADKTDNMPEIYLYQNEEYLCKAMLKGAYNESKAERTDNDEVLRKQQSEHTAKFDAKVKQRTTQLQKLAVVKRTHLPDEGHTIETDMDFWNKKAINDL